MKYYVGSCVDIDNIEDHEISKYFPSANELSNFLDHCQKISLENIKNQIDLKFLKDLNKKIKEQDPNIEAGIFKGYDDGMVFIYDKDQDIHYFFI